MMKGTPSENEAQQTIPYSVSFHSINMAGTMHDISIAKDVC